MNAMGPPYDEIDEKIFGCFADEDEDLPLFSLVRRIKELILQVSLSACHDSKLQEELERLQNEGNS